MLYFFSVLCRKYAGNSFLNVNHKYKTWNMITPSLKTLFFLVFHHKAFETVVSSTEEGSIDIGMIIGCVIAGVVFLAILIILVLCLRKKTRKRIFKCCCNKWKRKKQQKGKVFKTESANEIHHHLCTVMYVHI